MTSTTLAGCVSYCRVSKEESENTASLATQAERNAKFAEAMGHHIDVTLSDDGYSGGTLGRPDMRRLLASLEAGRVTAICVFHLDRLTRNLRDLLRIVDLCKKHNVTLLSVNEKLDTSTAFGQAMLHMLGVFAEWQRNAIGEKTKASLAQKKANGAVYCKTTPYGKRKVGRKLVANPGQVAVLEEIREQRAAGLSLRAIAAALNARREPSAFGGQWHSGTVHKILAAQTAA